MRVLYLHQHFTTPEKGGGTRSYELAKRLVARGHSVCIVCGEFAKLDLTPTDKKAISRGVIDGINVIDLFALFEHRWYFKKSSHLSSICPTQCTNCFA